jgi:hypothetical protein
MRLTRRKIMSQKQTSPAFVAQIAPARLIPVWALGETRPMTHRERKLTAAIYAQIPGVLEHVRREGKLPARIGGGGREVGLRVLVQRRGIDIELTQTEREVFDAIRGEGDLAEGWAVVIDGGRDGRHAPADAK